MGWIEWKFRFDHYASGQNGSVNILGAMACVGELGGGLGLATPSVLGSGVRATCWLSGQRGVPGDLVLVPSLP